MIGSGGAEQIRVYFSDDTFSTIKIDKCATAKEVCGQLMKKKKQAAEFEQYFLFVSDFNPFLPISGLYCRKLEDEEVPYLVLMAVQKEGLLRNFKFVFKALEEEFDNHFLLRSMSYIGKKNPFKRFETCQLFGYLDKISGSYHPSAWKASFFTFSNGELSCYKNHESLRPVSITDMEDCQISELKEYSQDGHIFQIISAGENLILRASTREEMNRWVQVLFQHTFIQSSENAIFVRIDEQIDQVEHKKNCLREIFYDDVCSFQTFITHKTALTDFKSYLEETGPNYSIDFFLAVQEYKTSESPQSFVKMEAIKIFQTYLGPNAPLSVQALATKQSSEFLVKIQRDSHVSRNIFDDLVEKVLNDLGAREFRDYTQSKQFRHLQLTLHAPIPTLNELVDYEYDEKILELVNSTLRNRISLLSLRNDPESSEWDMDFNSSIPRGKNGRNMTGSLQFQSSLDDVSRRRNQKLFTSNI